MACPGIYIFICIYFFMCKVDMSLKAQGTKTKTFSNIMGLLRVLHDPVGFEVLDKRGGVIQDDLRHGIPATAIATATAIAGVY